MKFTDKFIQNLKPQDKMYQLREGDGFGIRVLPSGLRIWIFTYTFDGKRRQMNIGSYPEKSLAEAKRDYAAAYSVLHDKNNPRDPQAERDQQHDKARQQREELRNAPTVKDLCGDYIKKYAKSKKKSWQQDEDYIKREITPVWGERKVADIRKRDFTLLLENIIERGSPVTCNRVRSLVIKMFNFAIERDLLEYNPCSAVKPMHKEKPKERSLTESEIHLFWNNIDNANIIMSPDLKRALKLILVTAQRPGEVTGMHRDEITQEWSGKWMWTIPGARTKNGRTHRICLTKTALELIGDKDGYIFESVKTDKDGNPRPIDEKSLARALRRNIKGENYRQDKVKRRKGVEYKRGQYKSKPLPEEPNRLGVDHFTPHDLRRTANTLMSGAKVIKEHRERVLNHTLEKLDGTYNLHDYDDEKQLALETLERRIKSILSGKQSNVIPITAAKAA